MQEEENEHHANRSLHADPEGEDRKERRVRERMKAYDEMGVGIAAHQPAAATSDDAQSDEDADDDGETRGDAEEETAQDEN
ncbi:MAG TPA: hypothetical protein VFG69_04590 [Nannocystaceae bacterium]|nr:hypothetical protein [Nannocystaceae bacterium]